MNPVFKQNDNAIYFIKNLKNGYTRQQFFLYTCMKKKTYVKIKLLNIFMDHRIIAK